MEETFITSPHFANEKAESRRLPKITVRFQGSMRRAGQMATLAGETSRVISGTLGHLHSASLHSGSWDGYFLSRKIHVTLLCAMKQNPHFSPKKAAFQE